MKIEKRSQLVIGTIYTIYKADLSQNMIKMNLSKPAEYLFEGFESGYRLILKKKLKSGKYSTKSKMVYCNTEPESKIWVKMNNSYAEACELYDADIEMSKEKLYKNSILMKELHDNLDDKKIFLRKNKLNRLL